MTGILCSMVGATFSVAAVAEVLRSKKSIIATGNAQVDTAQSKFGGASLLLDGTDDRLEIYPTTTYDDFTVECWIRLANNSGTKNILAFGNESSGRVFFAVYNDRIYWDQYGVTSRHGNTSMSANTWYNLAWSRTGSTIKLFVNGVEQTMTTVSGSGTFPSGAVGNTNGIFVGTLSDGAIDFNGHIDEIRVSNSARYTATFTPSAAAFVNDSNTLLLLHCDGTDASTVFEDDNGQPPFVARTAKTITTVGNAQVDTAQSQFGGASALFDGTGDYLTIPGSSSFNFGTGNFTIEMWFRRISGGAIDIVVGNRGTGFVSGNFAFYTYSSSIEFDYRNDLVANNTLTTSISNNIWYHFAIVRNGTSLTLYKDGAVGQAKTIGSTETFGSSSIDLSIGCNIVGTFPLNGYIDELRISNTARYTTTFTPSTAPFVNDPNTLLLIHADGADASTVFTDDNISYRSKKGITAIGNAQVDTAQSKFGGASALFDGTGDYLTIPYSADITRFHDNTNFTIEYSIRVGNFSNVSTGGSNASIVAGHQSHNGDAQYWSFGPISDGNVKFYYFSGAANQYTTSGITLVTNTWYHLAAVKSTNSLKIYVNGVERGSGTISNTPQYSTSYPFILGSFNNVSFNGHLDEIRISNSARYTANFTAPSAPFTNDANTLLLIHMDGTDASTFFEDDNGVSTPGRTQKHISYYGNAQIDTAQSQFGGSSALFDGNGDSLQLDTSAALTIPFSENFTIEGYIRAGSVSGTPGLLTDRSSSTSLTGVNFDISVFNGTYITSRTNTLLFETGSSAGSIIIISNNNVLTTNTWYHFAVVRSSNVITLYVDGVDVTNNRTGTQSSAIGAGNLTIGGFPNNNLMYSGHMDEIRWSNTARYTAAFTPSTTPFQDDANTVLLLHMDGTDAATVFVDDVGGRSKKGISAVGNAQVDTAQSKFGNTSLLTDGNDSLLVNFAASTDFEFTAGEDFTLEAWVRLTTINQFNVIISLASARSVNEYSLYIESVGGVAVATAATFGGGNLSRGTTNLSTGTFNHVAVSRSGTTVRLFVNGTQEDSDTYTFTAGQASTMRVGSFADTSNGVNGHIDEVRVSNIARYTTTFTPSATPFVNDTNTLLLLHCDGTDGGTVFTDDNGVSPDYDYGA